MSERVKVTVRFPGSLREEMLRAVIHDGYGMRGKSTWVSEALKAFLALETFVDLVDIGGELGDTALTAIESFYLSLRLADQLDSAVITVRRTHPALEGVKSIIIRSSVLQRLLRPQVLRT